MTRRRKVAQRLKCTFCPNAAVRSQVINPRTLEQPELGVRDCGNLSCIIDANAAVRRYEVIRVERGEIRT